MALVIRLQLKHTMLKKLLQQVIYFLFGLFLPKTAIRTKNSAGQQPCTRKKTGRKRTSPTTDSPGRKAKRPPVQKKGRPEKHRAPPSARRHGRQNRTNQMRSGAESAYRFLTTCFRRVRFRRHFLCRTLFRRWQSRPFRYRRRIRPFRYRRRFVCSFSPAFSA